MAIKQILTQFDVFLKEKCPNIYSQLGSPLAEQKVREYMSKLGIADELFFELYSWKNGISTINPGEEIDFKIMPQGNFLSLEDIVRYSEENVLENYWSALTLKPIMTNYDGEWILIDGDKESSNFGILYLCSANFVFDSEFMPCFDSIESLLLSTIRLFESGVQTYEGVRMELETDIDEYHRICGELNPRSEFWERG